MTISTKNILRNITPAVVVMAAGLLGATLFMESNLNGEDSTASLTQIAPAAGVETFEGTDFFSRSDFPPMPDVTMNEVPVQPGAQTIVEPEITE